MRDRLKKAPGPEYVATILRPRFEEQLEPFFPYVIQVNTAWMVMLAKCKLISKADAAAMCRELRALRKAGPTALLPYEPAKEEIYLHVESYLTQRLGEEIAGNNSLARTRPEPLTRMITRDRVLEELGALLDLRAQLLDLAGQHVDAVMPGYTHLQHAQPTTFAHYLLAVQDALARDTQRLLAAYDTTDCDTLGSAALAGTSLPVDREFVDRLLGFPRMVENTFDCVSSADYSCETAAAVATMHTTLSRFAMDLAMWHTSEFGMVEVSDEHAAMSSLMPQKKNPSPFEYVRFRSAWITGDLMAVLGTGHNVPFQDLLDVYVDTGPMVWHSLEASTGILRLLKAVLSGLTIHSDRMLEGARAGFSTATELAEVLVLRTGISYRTAHHIVASVVSECVASGKRASEVDAEMVNRAAKGVVGRELGIQEEWVRNALDPVLFVQSHTLPGGPAPATVRKMLQNRVAGIEQARATVNELHQALKDASSLLEAEVDKLIETAAAA